jgi:signal transduction histidine kinase
VTVLLRTRGDLLALTVADDGAGIAADAPRGRGLDNLGQRAEGVGGTLDIRSGPTGTVVDARLPLREAPALAAAR